MAKVRAYIVEDEAKAVDLISTYINRMPHMELVGVSRNAMKAFTFLQEHQIDLLFLDINMPILSGIELIKSLRNPPSVIFTTAYAEYAVEGFNLEAVDYLVKPISFPRFLKACERYKKLFYDSKSTHDKIDQLLADSVYVKSGPITHKLSWRDILYLEKDENYVVYHTASQRILSRQTMSELEGIFPSYICRIHKSYAVSLLHVDRFDRESLRISGHELPIGRTYRDGLLRSIDELG